MKKRGLLGRVLEEKRQELRREWRAEKRLMKKEIRRILSPPKPPEPPVGYWD